MEDGERVGSLERCAFFALRELPFEVKLWKTGRDCRRKTRNVTF